MSAQFRSLLKDTNVSFDNSGEISIHNQKIPHSNISDLLNKAVNPNCKISNLPGWESFKTVLADANIPQSLLVSKTSKASNQYATTKKPVKSPSTPVRNTRLLQRWTPYDSHAFKKRKL